MLNSILSIINVIRNNKGLDSLQSIQESTNLRTEIGFDSFDLAEFTVRVEEVYSVDIFEDGVLSTVKEVIDTIERKK